MSDRYWFWLRLVDAAGNSGEWTAAVAGRSDPNPAPIVAQLRGAIEKSSLSKALIDSLDADAASKVAAEAQARVAAIQAASKKAADDLAAKARELGTKITAVETVNTEQARQIQAVTAAQGNTAAGLEAEKRARAEGDRAEAQARETLVGRVASAEGSINTLRETVVRNDGVRAEEVKTLKASIDNLQVGGRNLIRDSAVTVQNANYLIQTYTLSDNMLQEGEPVVVTIWGDLGSDREAFWPFNSNGWNWLGVMKKVSDGVYRIVTTWKRSKNNPSNDRLLIYCGPNTGTTVSRIDRIKLERGTVGTDWSPAPEDEAARREAALTQYRQAQAQKDAALSEEQKTLKAELSGQKARVEQSASALASLDGKVRAMYGLKVETVSGGRKVIAGLALGADGQTGDSQMLVYADKFAIVDPKSKVLKSPFVVQTAGGKTQMALSGDFVADGLIHGRQIAAGQTLSSPSIEGGSLNIGGGQFTVSSDSCPRADRGGIRLF